ncbi:methyltransferase [Flavobacterium suaedae]|uniref:Methyltransferase n=1 Tax=Flavobacterium suaedae TaxID=1767027 RepID=A0ABQ1K222_9FLAO|nr:class I SAM-dependent methyltransferase [Flavobacterium suaedae]GGB80758.1 methyltransferase [Flavobacterium suaedae]
MEKLTETELEQLASHLRCPDGSSGIEVADVMNSTNANIITKTINSLDISIGDTILEIGPGNGKHVSELINKANDLSYFGIDISETMITEAKQNNSQYNNTSFQLVNGENIPFEDNIFSKVFTVNTIYFWENPIAYATEIARVMQPEGILSIGFIPESTMRKIPFAKYGFTMQSVPSVIAILEKSGLIVLNSTLETEKIVGNSGNAIEREIVVLTAKK